MADGLDLPGMAPVCTAPILRVGWLGVASSDGPGSFAVALP